MLSRLWADICQVCRGWDVQAPRLYIQAFTVSIFFCPNLHFNTLNPFIYSNTAIVILCKALHPFKDTLNLLALNFKPTDYDFIYEIQSCRTTKCQNVNHEPKFIILYAFIYMFHEYSYIINIKYTFNAYEQIGIQSLFNHDT